ncbi:hypothetical protein ONZ51_g2380 [Trametes cubensis]|uniref:Uncharacterized protein n=1 Tax=Trametes cubensis TaxID=1111947 RepID=A0AAD7U0R9_9APHY|nr:hypothetical protein ONZ51_g2380 [Trametes cubensis]
MPGLALLSPINESEELSPYQNAFRYGRHHAQRSPISKASFQYQYVKDAPAGSPVSGEVTMDDIWIYDCYVSEDATSPGGYPRSPSTASHSRSISLPSTTASLSPIVSVPVVRVPSPINVHAARNLASHDTQLAAPVEDTEIQATELTYGTLPTITTSVFSPETPAEYPEYSPLEQEEMTIWEVIDELASAADQFAGLETLLSDASAAERPPELDEDTAFWFIEGLNLLISDYTKVAEDLLEFNGFVEQLLSQEQELAPPDVVAVKHASFSEQDSKEVLATAAKISEVEVRRELAKLEAAVPHAPKGKRRSRERPPSLKLSTDDAVLLQAIRPRSRLQSVGALGRFSEAELDSRTDMLKRHRAYAIYGEETPVDDNCSIRSLVDYDAIEPMAEIKQGSPEAARPRPTSGQSMIPRPLSSPVTLAGAGRSFARRPPSLTLTDPASEQSSQHSASSSVSSLFSALPRSSTFTNNSSPRSSPRQSITFDGKPDKPRFLAASGNMKKMFTNLFKKREGIRNSVRPFGKRTAGGTGSVDATLSALSLSAMSSSVTVTPLALGTEPDPFAASPPPPLRTPPPTQPHARSASEASPLDGYSSMFNPVKAASRYPPQPLFGEPTP